MQEILVENDFQLQFPQQMLNTAAISLQLLTAISKLLSSEGDYSLFQLITDYYYYYSKVIDYSIIYDY